MARLRWRLLSTKLNRIKRRNTQTTSRDYKRDWRELPPELLFLISQKLADLRYFIRFRAVCKSWCSSVLLSDHPLQIPWLLECDDIFIEGTRFSEELHFYSLADASPETKTGSIPIKECHHSSNYQGTGNGYLLVMDDCDLSLLNPLTNNTISLPPVPSNCISLFPVFFSSSDLVLAGRIFLGCDHGNWSCGIYHPDKMEWKCIDSDCFNTCYLNGMLFTTFGFDCTNVFDVTSGKKLYEIPQPEDEGPNAWGCYLVESCGVILRLSLYNTRDVDTNIFSIYKLNFERGEGQPCWVKVNNIGDQILFLDVRNGISVKATDGFKKNSIYFITEDKHSRDHSLWRYDIATGIIEMLHCPFERFMWFIPKIC
ncbi:F-box protein (DUF295) [Rhynchospora pubera]|uniref:F-box protein (DUF295) n=1 Tax=Rhynchospora pubera TaxID=906938 RepID=A0AAV8DCI8_9POAL|nr:F-box protein (DUF295) [Rhynchospora pubera]